MPARSAYERQGQGSALEHQVGQARDRLFNLYAGPEWAARVRRAIDAGTNFIAREKEKRWAMRAHERLLQLPRLPLPATMFTLPGWVGGWVRAKTQVTDC
jgi:hypothetical protein